MTAQSNQAIEKSIEEESYDELPYESYAYSQTHPDRLHMVATLFQMAPTPINKCRILELGCAMGGNIAPLSLKYPDSYVLGVDISGEQIQEANNLKEYLGVKNLEFQQADISKLDKGIGKFDYIICHGVFSWVPDAVRDSIFKVCREHLTDNGLAVISYNTLPGWGAVNTLRDMMLFHSKNFESPSDQIREAKALLGFLKENGTTQVAYKDIIERELEILKHTNDSYIFHEHLETENHQFYVSDFAEMAKKHKLTYVGDSDVTTMYVGNFNKNVQETLSAIPDLIRQEQYMDFLNNRRFRQSIITKEENEKNINRAIKADAVLDLYLFANYKAENNGEISADGKAVFAHTNQKHKITTNDRISSELLLALMQETAPIKFSDLAQKINKTKNISIDDLKTAIIKNGLLLALQDYIALSSDSLSFKTKISDKPQAYPVALYQAQNTNCLKLTNKRMQAINTDRVTKTVVAMLDGTHTIDDIAQKLLSMAENKEISIQIDGKDIADKEKVFELVKSQVQNIVQQFANNAFLEA